MSPDTFSSLVELTAWIACAIGAWHVGTRYGYTSWPWRVAQVVLPAFVLLGALLDWLWLRVKRVIRSGSHCAAVSPQPTWTDGHKTTIERGIKRILIVLSALAGPAWMSLAVASSRKGLINLAVSDWLLVALLWGMTCGVLWVAFYTLRWIVRGFREPKGGK